MKSLRLFLLSILLRREVQVMAVVYATLKLNNDHYVALEVLDRICEVLNCPIEAVVEITKGPDK